MSEQTADETRARTLLDEAQRLQTAGDRISALKQARDALAAWPDFPEALEFVGTALVTRRRKFDEGLAMLDRAVRVRPDDAGLWYGRGWCYEFAAHETKRTPRPGHDARGWYETAAESFRVCLSLSPGGKLEGDAVDLLDHVENELLSM